MQNNKIVLDTNCLLVSISKYGEAYPVWRGFLEGRFTLCVSTEILEEYEEIIASMTTPDINPYFHWQLITTDPDDNKFVDCAFAAGAAYIVSDDSHFDVLRDITFPPIAGDQAKRFYRSAGEGGFLIT